MSLVGGYAEGGQAFWASWNNTTGAGKVVKYGMEGVVQRAEGETALIVKFGDALLKCTPEKLAKAQPSLKFASGYELDDSVFFIGATQELGGTKLESGTEGAVAGDSGSPDLVAVKFPALKAVIKLELAQVSKGLPKAVSLDGGVVLGTYIGHGAVDGCDCSYTLTLNEKKLFWLDYKKQPPIKTAPAEQFHADGRFDILGDKVKITFGGLPGVGRQGQVWEFGVDAGGGCLTRDGLKIFPQSDTGASTINVSKAGAVIGQKAEPVNKLKLGPYISADFERTPEGKKLVDTCRYTITLLEDNMLWLDFESQSKIDQSKWHVEGTYEETSDTKIQYKVEARPWGGGPAVNSVLSLDMDLKAGTLVFDSVKCILAGGITAVEMENISQAKPDMKALPKTEPKVAATPVAAGDTLTLAQLQDEKVWKPKGVDKETRETYLSDAEFQTVLGTNKADFAALPKWKKDTAKKKHGLF